MQIATYPEIKDKNFNRDIFRRREFHVEKDGKKNIDAVQTRLKRYQGPRTGYENLLLFHEMGSGKTRSSLSIAENALISPSEFVGSQNKVWVGREWFQPSQRGIGGRYTIKSWEGNNVTVDITPWGKGKVNKEKWCKARGGCTQILRLDQIPPLGNRQKIIFVSKTTKFAQEIVEPELEKMYPNLSAEQIKVHLQKHYILMGYNQFSQIVEEKPNWIDNSVVIIDEVHNLVPMDMGREDRQKKRRYQTIKKALRRSQNRFVVLLTGTPMINSPNEVVWILQLFTEEDAAPDPNKMNIDKVKEWTKVHSKGVVSYLKKVSTSVPMKFLGKKVAPLSHFKVVGLPMQGYQLEAYQKLGAAKDFNTLHRQYGIIAPQPGKEWSELTYKEMRKSDVFKRGGRLLRNVSVKYNWIIDKLTASENVPMYVYSNYINGGGIQFLVDILRSKGYSPLIAGQTGKARRYLLITGSLLNKKELIRTFNQRANRDGSICKIIIGGPSSIEGFTFKNIRMEVILNPPFSYSDIAQALARGVRAGSHDPPRPAYVKAVQLIAQPGNKLGVDLEMYSKMEKKDVRIKEVEYILKKNAWDCGFNKMNNVGAVDYSRECDYKKCDYQCDGVPQEEIDNPQYNTNTWDIYYAPREPIEYEIIRIFSEVTSIGVPALINRFKGRFSTWLILTTIDDLVKTRQPMPQWYGRNCYLTRAADHLFLTHNMLGCSPVLARSQAWYVENPTWYPHPGPPVVTSVEESNDLAAQVKNLLTGPQGVLQGRRQTDQPCPAIGQFPLNIQFKLLIGALLAQRTVLQPHPRKVAEEILNYFTPVTSTTDEGNIVVSLLFEFASPPGDLKVLPSAAREIRDATALEKKWYLKKMSRRPKSIYGTQNISQPGNDWSCAFCLVPRNVDIPAELLKDVNKHQWGHAWKKFSRNDKINEKGFKEMLAWLQKDFERPLKPKRLKEKAQPLKPPWTEEQAKGLLRKLSKKGLHQKTVGSNICADARLSAKALIGHLLDLKVSPPTSLAGLNNQPYGKSCPVSKLSPIPKAGKWDRLPSKTKVWKQIQALLKQPLVNGKKSGGTLDRCRWTKSWGKKELKKALEGYSPYLEKAGTKSILQGALLKKLREIRHVYPDQECAKPTRLKK